MIACLAGVYAYAVVYWLWIREPLTTVTRDLSSNISKLIWSASLLPFIVLGVFALFFYFRSEGDPRSEGGKKD
jgi:hypothetical protein